MPDVLLKRGTWANFKAQATAAGLIVGQQYLITDKGWVAVALSTTTFRVVGGDDFEAMRWSWNDFGNSGNLDPFGMTLLASGTTASPAAGLTNKSGALLVRSSTTTNSGARIQTGQPICGATGLAFRGIIAAHTLSTKIVRMGFHDSTTQADAVDGVYWEINGLVATLKSSNNSTRTTGTGSFTMTVDTYYIFDIDYTSTTAAIGTIYDLSEASQFSTTVSSNVPNSNIRTFNAGIVATDVGTVANGLVTVDYMGFGPKRPSWATI